MYRPSADFAACRFAADVLPQPLPWLWPGRIPLGRLTLLIGDPGVGKSLLATDLAARVTTAAPMPEAPSDSANPTDPTSIPRSPDPSIPIPTPLPAGVVIASSEDRLEDTIHPRLTAAGADLQRVCILEGVTETYQPFTSSDPAATFTDLDYPDPAHRLLKDPVAPSGPSPTSIPGSLDPSIPMPFTLSQNLDALAQAVRALDHPRLVILDPLPSLLAPVTEFSEPDPRPLLKTKPDGVVTLLNTIARIAKTYNVAILAITHCTKSAQPAIYRARGSIAVTAAARSVLLLTDHPLDPQTRVLHTIKSLYGPPPDPIAFTITAKPGAPAPRLDWTSDPIGSPILLPGSLSPSSLRRSVASSHSSLTEAADWLTHALSAGPKLARDLIAEARLDGISLGSLRRAKSILAVQSANSTPGWIWSLP